MTENEFILIDDLDEYIPDEEDALLELPPLEIQPNEIATVTGGNFPGWIICDPKRTKNLGWIPADGRGSTRVDVTGKWTPNTTTDGGPVFYGPKGRPKDHKYAVLLRIDNGKTLIYPGKPVKIPQLPGMPRTLYLWFNGATKKSANHPDDPIRARVDFNT